MPGTDHAGIATQAVVERRIRDEEKKTRHDLGREELVRRIWQWKDQYEARILNQLRQLGCSCDWARTRFTLDDICARAVRVTFFKMFADGYIYRGKRLVNWDTQLQTSVADHDSAINENGGKYAGMDRFEAREAVTQDMDKLGLFDGREDRDIELAHSDRSKTPIEPYLSDQWFVQMGDRADGKPGLAQLAIDAVTSGRVKFFPDRSAHTYLAPLGGERDPVSSAH